MTHHFHRHCTAIVEMMTFVTRGRRLQEITRQLVTVCGADGVFSLGTDVGVVMSRKRILSSQIRGITGSLQGLTHGCFDTRRPTRNGLQVLPQINYLYTNYTSYPYTHVQTRNFAFAGHPQIRNAEGQDMAQVRAGVRLRKALCSVLEHPSVSHRFEHTGLTILEVRMGKDFKKAHVRWTVADAGDDNGYNDVNFERKKQLASKALKQNATTLRAMASKMLRSKHTPRLVFVDDDLKTEEEKLLDEAFDRVKDDEAAMEAHLLRIKKSEREYSEARKKGLVKPGKYDFDDLYEGQSVTNSMNKNQTDPKYDADTPKGYAFEHYDGSAPYVSDFVEEGEPLGVDEMYDSDADENLDDDDETINVARTKEWATKVHLAAAALQHAEEDWLSIGGPPKDLDPDGFDLDFDQAVDELVDEISISAKLDDEEISENVRAIRLAAERAISEAEYDDDELIDQDSEYIDGDEFDDDDVDDFDFEKFDKAKR